MDKIVLKYLDICGFKIVSENKTYTKRNFIDIIITSIYFIVSVICIIIDEASIVVLLLNYLCLARVIIKNTIRSSELTDLLKEKQKNKTKKIGSYHYFHVSLAELAIGVISFIIVITMSFDTNFLLIKVVSILVALTVLLDDFEDIMTRSWGAKINPDYE